MKKTILRIILLILLGITFGLIFYFSHQPAVDSDATSGKLIQKILNGFPYTKDLTQPQKDRLEKRLQPIVRKLAHVSIYTMLGIFIMSFICTYNLILIKKFLISIWVGVTYAISDEIHQYYTPRKKLRNSRYNNRFISE